jgi:hypothetical protein
MMLEELQRRNYAKTTVQYYIQAVEGFAKHFHRLVRMQRDGSDDPPIGGGAGMEAFGARAEPALETLAPFAHIRARDGGRLSQL